MPKIGRWRFLVLYRLYALFSFPAMEALSKEAVAVAELRGLFQRGGGIDRLGRHPRRQSVRARGGPRIVKRTVFRPSRSPVFVNERSMLLEQRERTAETIQNVCDGG